MIIGNGNIAKVIQDREDVIFFASGVSDSSCTDENEFIRERDLIHWTDRTKHLVYFSGLNIYTKDTPYAMHKKRMERHVKHLFKSYTIVRVGVLDWVKNPNLSSGIGRSLTFDFKNGNVPMYIPVDSLAIHGDHESQMHPEERKRNPLISR